MLTVPHTLTRMLTVPHVLNRRLTVPHVMTRVLTRMLIVLQVLTEAEALLQRELCEWVGGLSLQEGAPPRSLRRRMDAEAAARSMMEGLQRAQCAKVGVRRGSGGGQEGVRRGSGGGQVLFLFF
jgi:hypothetical protein